MTIPAAFLQNVADALKRAYDEDRSAHHTALGLQVATGYAIDAIRDQVRHPLVMHQEHCTAVYRVLRDSHPYKCRQSYIPGFYFRALAAIAIDAVSVQVGYSVDHAHGVDA